MDVPEMPAASARVVMVELPVTLQLLVASSEMPALVATPDHAVWFARFAEIVLDESATSFPLTFSPDSKSTSEPCPAKKPRGGQTAAVVNPALRADSMRLSAD